MSERNVPLRVFAPRVYILSLEVFGEHGLLVVLQETSMHLFNENIGEWRDTPGLQHLICRRDCRPQIKTGPF
jgi:hypothetical protein